MRSAPSLFYLYSKLILVSTLLYFSAQLCSKVMEMIAASKALRNEMKSMIQSIYASKAEAHHKITYGLAKSVVDSKAHQVCISSIRTFSIIAKG